MSADIELYEQLEAEYRREQVRARNRRRLAVVGVFLLAFFLGRFGIVADSGVIAGCAVMGVYALVQASRR